MVRVSIAYPSQPGARFDLDYYVVTHMPLVKQLVGGMGLVRVEVDKAISGPMGSPAPFACVGYLYFDSLASVQRALETHAAAIQADIPNYTDIPPQIQISEIAAI